MTTDLKTDLDRVRTFMANERTFLAYLRTALSFLAFGLIIVRLFAQTGLYILIGLGSIVIGVGLFFFGVGLYLVRQRQFAQKA